MKSKRLLTIALCVAALGTEAVVLEWIGKSKVVNHHLDVPCHVLEKKWSHGGDDSGNMVIKGDNLLALKALLPRYAGKVKCIYIDPPYNTGNEGWCYNDNVNDPTIQRWLNKVVGKEGEDFTRHDKWLCMMYPRLKLLQQLLAEDGVIFISIDDNEQANLRLICDEIFGSRNYVAEMPRITKKAGKTTDDIAKNHDWLFVYGKSAKSSVAEIGHDDKDFKYEDEYVNERGKYKLNQTLDYDSLQYSSSMDYPLTIDGEVFYPGTDKKLFDERQKGNHKKADWIWRWSKDLFEFGYKNGFVVIKRSRNGTRIYTKTYQRAAIVKNGNQYEIVYSDRTRALSSLELIQNEYSNDNAKKELKAIFGVPVFEYPKPSTLVGMLVKLTSTRDSIVLDSFSGSGTTAHAVMNLNKADGGNRKFILVEMCDYAETITAERVKRVIDGYGEESKHVEGTGGAFSFYELGEPLMVDEELNEKVATEKIREYVYYTEVNKPLPDLGAAAAKEPYLMGVEYDTAYYFCYEKGKVVTLDRALLKTIKTKADQYVVYADKCALSEAEIRRRHITFKKIPRDITRL